MSVKEYNAADVWRRTAAVLLEAIGGVSVIIRCDSVEQVRKIYGNLNVQRFRRKQGSMVSLHKDEAARLVCLEQKCRECRPEKEAVQLACPIEAPSEASFEWRKPGKEQEGDIFYFCDADMRGFFVPDGIMPPYCPYCGADDAFAREGEVPPYRRELRLQRQATKRRGEYVIAPQADDDD